MANKSFPFGKGSSGAVRFIANPLGNVGPTNQPSWGDRTPKPDNLKPAPATGPVAVGRDTAATPLVNEPSAESVAACDAGNESPNDVGQEEKS